MATWNMGQYDSIENDARRMDEIEYARQRQAVLDKRAAQDYALKHRDDLRKDELAEINHAYQKRNMDNSQKLADWDIQKKTNAMRQEQAEASYKNITPEQRSLLNILANGTATNIKFKGRDYGPASSLSQNQIRRFGLNPLWVQIHQNAQEAKINKEKATELSDLEHQSKVGDYKLKNRVNQEKTVAVDRANLQREFSSRDYSPYREAVLKLRASGGNVNALTDAEKDIILQPVGLMPNEDGALEYFNRISNLSNEQLLKETGVNPAFIPLYAEQQRAAAAKNAEYQLKNAPAIAKQARDEQYKTVSGFMTGLFNSAVAKRTIDPEKAKSEEIIEAATNIYNNAKNSGQDITPQQAFNMAAGINTNNNNPPPQGVSEVENNQLYRLYGKRYKQLDDETKAKLAAVYSDWKEHYEPSSNLSGDEYLKAAQKSAIAFRDLLIKHELPEDLNTPIDEELYHLEYDDILKTLRVGEERLKNEFPRWYEWVKNNPNESIGSNKMMRNLTDESMYTWGTTSKGDAKKILKPEYQKFFDELSRLHQLRKDLVNREAWGRKADRNRRYGK